MHPEACGRSGSRVGGGLRGVESTQRNSALGPRWRSMPTGNRMCFWRGRSGSLWETWYTSKWNGPQELAAAQLESAPAAGVDAAGDEYVFWQGTDAALWENSFAGGGWSTPIKVGSAGRIDSGPAVAVHGNGEQDVFWKGTNGNLWEMWYTNRWNGPEDLLGGELGSAPTAGVDAAGNEYVFWQGTDGGLWRSSTSPAKGGTGPSSSLSPARSAQLPRSRSMPTASKTCSTGARTAGSTRFGTRPSGTGRKTWAADSSAPRRLRARASTPRTNGPQRDGELA